MWISVAKEATPEKPNAPRHLVEILTQVMPGQSEVPLLIV